MPELVDGQPVYPMTPQQFAACGPAAVAAGASFIGGCCGTNPDHVRALKEELRHVSSDSNGVQAS
jgi:5-methyltetrahydrofolate--homocysteine methyltransferase